MLSYSTGTVHINMLFLPKNLLIISLIANDVLLKKPFNRKSFKGSYQNVKTFSNLMSYEILKLQEVLGFLSKKILIVTQSVG